MIVPITLILVLGLTSGLMSGCLPGPAPAEPVEPVAPVAPVEPVEPPAPLEPIKVGVMYPMSGAYAADGLEMIQPATLAVEDINAAGGLCGRPLEIVEADNKEMMAEDVATAAEILIGAGVDVVVCNYGGEPADILIYGKYDVPYINWNDSRTAQAAILDNLPETSNCYKLPPNGSALGPDPFKVMTEILPGDWGYEHPNKKLALLTMDADWAKDIANDVKKVVAEESDWEIVIDIVHPYGNTEYGTQLIKIREEEPAIIFFSSYAPSEMISFLNQFLEDPTDSLVFVTWLPCTPGFVEAAGEDAEGVLWGSQEALYGTPKQEEYRTKFKTRFEREPGSSNVYDVVTCWAAAVENSGCDPSDYDAVLKALVNYDFEGLLGTYDISEETHYGRSGADYIAHRFYQIQGGLHKVLYLGEEPYVGSGDYYGEFEVPPWIGN